MPYAFRPYGSSSGDRYHDDAMLDAAVREDADEEELIAAELRVDPDKYRRDVEAEMRSDSDRDRRDEDRKQQEGTVTMDSDKGQTAAEAFLQGQAAALNATYKALDRPRVPAAPTEDMPELRRQRDALLAAAERVLAEITTGEMGEYLEHELGPAVRAARGEATEAKP